MADGITPDRLVGGIADALADRNLGAAVDMLEALAVLDPQRAQAAYDTMQAGIAISRWQQRGTGAR
jgi:hypothetical protein